MKEKHVMIGLALLAAFSIGSFLGAWSAPSYVTVVKNMDCKTPSKLLPPPVEENPGGPFAD